MTDYERLIASLADVLQPFIHLPNSHINRTAANDAAQEVVQALNPHFEILWAVKLEPSEKPDELCFCVRPASLIDAGLETAQLGKAWVATAYGKQGRGDTEMDAVIALAKKVRS